MSEEKAREAAMRLKAANPLAHADLVLHLQELQAGFDEHIRYGLADDLLRQNQGKSQLCIELLKLLNS